MCVRVCGSWLGHITRSHFTGCLQGHCRWWWKVSTGSAGRVARNTLCKVFNFNVMIWTIVQFLLWFSASSSHLHHLHDTLWCSTLTHMLHHIHLVILTRSWRVTESEKSRARFVSPSHQRHPSAHINYYPGCTVVVTENRIWRLTMALNWKQ